MKERINSLELTRQLSKILKLSKEEETALYDELSQLPTGPVKEILNKFLKEKKLALNSLTGRKAFEGQEPKQVTRYVACIRGDSVRDAQYEKEPGRDDRDEENWIDAFNMPLFLEIVEASSQVRAKHIAAVHAKVNPDVIELYPID